VYPSREGSVDEQIYARYQRARLRAAKHATGAPLRIRHCPSNKKGLRVSAPIHTTDIINVLLAFGLSIVETESFICVATK
jgi:hypothetical protein